MSYMANDLVLTNKGCENGKLRIEARGRIGTNETVMLERKLNSALDETPLYLILNMRQVEYLSSSGIRILLATYKKAQKMNKSFRIEAPTEAVRNVLGMVNMVDLLMK